MWWGKMAIFLFLLLLASCRRKEGCGNPEAANYCPDCGKKREDLCEFEYTFGFWMTERFGRWLDSLGVDSVEVVIGYNRPDMSNFSQRLGMYARTQTFSAEPACNDARLLRYTVRYKVQDMPHTCSGGGILVGGTRCWIWQYTVSHPMAGVVKDGSFIIGPGVTGCHLIVLDR